MGTLNAKIVLNIKTAAEWANSMEILLKGELGIESDTRLIKVGNGVDTFINLPYTAVSDISGIEGITITNPADGQVLTYSNGEWINVTPSALPADTNLSHYDNSTSGFITASDIPALPADTDLSQYDNTTSDFASRSDIPTNVSQLTNDAGYITNADVPLVNNATLTVQKNGTSVATFTANSATDVTADITVPTKTSELTNDSGFITGVNFTLDALTDVTVTNPTYGQVLKFDGSVWVNGTDENQNPVWGNITGVLSDQTDLQAALDAKANSLEVAAKAQLTWDTPTTTLTLYLLDKYNNTIDTKSVLIPITSIIDNGYYDSNTQELVLVLADQSEIRIPASGLISGLQPMITSSNKLSASLVSGLSNVATSGVYNDLLNKPTIPTVNDATLTIQKNSTNVGTFTANASSNATIDISVPTDTGDLTNGAGFITSSDIPALPSNTDLSDYDNSVSGFITSASLPTVNDATLTIQKNSVDVGTFTANANSNATIDISVPTDTGDLTNGAGFITSASVPNLLPSNNTWTGTNTFNNTVQFNEDIRLTWTKNAYLHYIQFMTTADSMSIKMANNNTLNFTSPQFFSFRIGSTEKFRIDDSLVDIKTNGGVSGNFTVSGMISVYNEVRWNHDNVTNFGRIGLASDGKWWFRNGSSGGKYLANGGTAWQDYSDRRMKKNIVDLDSSLDKILALKPVRYDYKTDETDTSARVGFVAQDVYPVIPEAVDGTPDQEDYMGLGQETLIPFLVKAVQELSAKVEELEAKLKV